MKGRVRYIPHSSESTGIAGFRIVFKKAFRFSRRVPESWGGGMNPDRSVCVEGGRKPFYDVLMADHYIGVVDH